ncbi:hypothetical protein ABK040_001600 [Willaertia magna]
MSCNSMEIDSDSIKENNRNITKTLLDLALPFYLYKLNVNNNSLNNNKGGLKPLNNNNDYTMIATLKDFNHTDKQLNPIVFYSIILNNSENKNIMKSDSLTELKRINNLTKLPKKVTDNKLYNTKNNTNCNNIKLRGELENYFNREVVPYIKIITTENEFEQIEKKQRKLFLKDDGMNVDELFDVLKDYEKNFLFKLNDKNILNYNKLMIERNLKQPFSILNYYQKKLADVLSIKVLDKRNDLLYGYLQFEYKLMDDGKIYRNSFVGLQNHLLNHKKIHTSGRGLFCYENRVREENLVPLRKFINFNMCYGVEKIVSIPFVKASLIRPVPSPKSKQQQQSHNKDTRQCINNDTTSEEDDDDISTEEELDEVIKRSRQITNKIMDDLKQPKNKVGGIKKPRRTVQVSHKSRKHEKVKQVLYHLIEAVKLMEED